MYVYILYIYVCIYIYFSSLVTKRTWSLSRTPSYGAARRLGRSLPAAAVAPPSLYLPSFLSPSPAFIPHAWRRLALSSNAQHDDDDDGDDDATTNGKAKSPPRALPPPSRSGRRRYAFSGILLLLYSTRAKRARALLSRSIYYPPIPKGWLPHSSVSLLSIPLPLSFAASADTPPHACTRSRCSTDPPSFPFLPAPNPDRFLKSLTSFSDLQRDASHPCNLLSSPNIHEIKKKISFFYLNCLTND